MVNLTPSEREKIEAQIKVISKKLEILLSYINNGQKVPQSVLKEMQQW